MIDPRSEIQQLNARLRQMEDSIISLEQFIGLSGSSSVGHARLHGTDSHIPRNNYTATAAPTSTDDKDDNYGVGSIWIDITNSNSYICLDATVGAAVWLLSSDVLDIDLKEGGVLLGGTGGVTIIDVKEGGVLVGSTSSGGASFIPSGGIIIWSGAVVDIPSGFVLCDGTNGTPDLRGLFVIGAGGAYAVGATGGASTHTHAGHSAHVVTQPGAHSAHVFTQPGAHADHIFTQPAGHSAHSVTQPSAHDAHIFTQPSGHSVHTIGAPSDHAAGTTGVNSGSAQAVGTGAATSAPHLHDHSTPLLTHTNLGTFGHSAHAGGDVDAHSAHSGTAVSAHSAHSGGAVDAHSVHAGGAVDAHSVHTGTAVDAHSAHDSPTSLPPYYSLAWIMKT